MDHENVQLDESVRVYAAARPSILVAEDDEDCARAVSIILGTNFDVAVHGNARDVVARFDIEVPDLLIFD